MIWTIQMCFFKFQFSTIYTNTLYYIWFPSPIYPGLMYVFLGFTFMVPNLVSKENSAACTYNLWTDYTSDSFYLIVRGCRLLRLMVCDVCTGVNYDIDTSWAAWISLYVLVKLKMCIYVHTRNLSLIIKVILLQKAPAHRISFYFISIQGNC